MLGDDIQTLEYFVKFYNGPNRVDKEWERIKKYCYEALNKANNTRFTQCPKCGSSRLCFWTCHDRYGCYDCDWVEAQRKA